MLSSIATLVLLLSAIELPSANPSVTEASGVRRHLVVKHERRALLRRDRRAAALNLRAAVTWVTEPTESSARTGALASSPSAAAVSRCD